MRKNDGDHTIHTHTHTHTHQGSDIREVSWRETKRNEIHSCST
jgi:hypothetical protein